MDQARYDAVVKAYCLLPDFVVLEDGDETEVSRTTRCRDPI
jgi:hypothetical protein